MANVVITPGSPYSFGAVKPSGTLTANFTITAPNGAYVINSVVLSDTTNFTLTPPTAPPFQVRPNDPYNVYDAGDNPHPNIIQIEFNPTATGNQAYSAMVTFTPLTAGVPVLVYNISGSVTTNTPGVFAPPTPSLGGVAATGRLTLFPMIDVLNGTPWFYCFDPSQGFNDPYAPSSHSFKVEEVNPGRNITIGRVILTYRDLGPCQATITISGWVDSGPGLIQPVSNSFVESLGTNNPTGRLYTRISGISATTGQNLQLTVGRAANAGPLSIARIKLEGRAEMTKYA